MRNTIEIQSLATDLVERYRSGLFTMQWLVSRINAEHQTERAYLTLFIASLLGRGAERGLLDELLKLASHIHEAFGLAAGAELCHLHDWLPCLGGESYSETEFSNMTWKPLFSLHHL